MAECHGWVVSIAALYSGDPILNFSSENGYSDGDFLSITLLIPDKC
jgi:hypothetical protein